VLVSPILDEGLYREMVEYFLPLLVKRAKKMVGAGADVIEVAGHWTGQVGPKTFQKYILEYENQLVKAIHETGALVIYHNCGDAARIMRFYNSLEIDCWGYLTPPPFADVVLDEALKVMRPTLTLRGNIDQVEFLMKATPEQVKERVREVLEKVKPRGNWILSTTDFFFDDTPGDNMRAFAEAGLDYGWY
jgi:uroporphyrinogen decarboxylase